jgi:hypothetical protein
LDAVTAVVDNWSCEWWAKEYEGCLPALKMEAINSKNG